MKRNELIFDLSMLIVAILLVVFGLKFSDKYLSSPSDKDIELYRQFCDEGQKTIAHFDREYTETSYKVGRGGSESKIYSIKYFYTVDGIEYSGKRVTNNLPEESSIEITYLKSKPGVSKWTKDSCEEYKTIQNKKKSVIYIIIGPIMFLIGLGIINNLFQRLKKMVWKK